MLYTDSQISDILDTYKKNKERSHSYYHTKKHDNDFMIKNTQRSKEYYNENKEEIMKKRLEKKELLNAKSLYYYYKKTNREVIFKSMFPHKYELIIGN